MTRKVILDSICKPNKKIVGRLFPKTTTAPPPTRTGTRAAPCYSPKDLWGTPRRAADMHQNHSSQYVTGQSGDPWPLPHYWWRFYRVNLLVVFANHLTSWYFAQSKVRHYRYPVIKTLITIPSGIVSRHAIISRIPYSVFPMTFT